MIRPPYRTKSAQKSPSLGSCGLGPYLGTSPSHKQQLLDLRPVKKGCNPSTTPQLSRDTPAHFQRTLFQSTDLRTDGSWCSDRPDWARVRVTHRNSEIEGLNNPPRGLRQPPPSQRQRSSKIQIVSLPNEPLLYLYHYLNSFSSFCGWLVSSGKSAFLVLGFCGWFVL